MMPSPPLLIGIVFIFVGLLFTTIGIASSRRASVEKASEMVSPLASVAPAIDSTSALIAQMEAIAPNISFHRIKDGTWFGRASLYLNGRDQDVSITGRTHAEVVAALAELVTTKKP